ncbi:hypothetical protein IW152_002084 [Coemansia sp. BCRC 34962]|nr:hypothetical protein IW152_002084 [Coemansia sp. BCRC 34962]
MAVFWLGRTKLRKAIYEAAANPSAYDKVYDIIAKHSNALTKAFDIVLKAIEDGWRNQQPLYSRKSTSSRRESSSNGGSSARSVHDAGFAVSPADVKQSTDILQVLHGIVHSFPREASLVFGDIMHATRLLACVRSLAIPLDVRLVLVSLASRWYVLLKSAPQAAKYLASVVDSFYNYTGLLPSLSFLLLTPHNVRRQQGWPYPPLERTDDLHSFMYVTPKNKKTQGSHSRNGSRNPRHSVGVFSDQVSGQSRSSRASKQMEPTSEQLEKMNNSAQELTSLGGMLIDNLVTLPIDENPQTNKVIQDMLKEMNRLNSLVASHILSLTGEHVQTTRRLKLATDETKRCNWVYKDSISAYEEWKYRQHDYVALSNNRLSMALSAGGGAGSSSLAPMQTAPITKQEIPALEPVPAPAPAPVPLERISTKAKGKMPDLAPPSTPPRI